MPSTAYDAKNHLISDDGEGHRFSKTNSSSINSGGSTPDPAGTTAFIYDPQGHLVHTEAPSSGSGGAGTGWRGEVYAGSRHLATYAGNLNIAHADWIGTERNRDSPDSNAPQYPANQNITGLPFGDWIDNSLGLSPEETPLNFTGQYHDFESDLDYFGARYYSSTTGRFLSPDPQSAGATLDAPQSWNAYSYVLNNPLNAVDPDGLDCVYLNDEGTGADEVDRESNSHECGQNGGTWFDGTINSNSVRTDTNSDWVSAAGVVGDTGSNQQFSCGGSACGQDALDSFVNSITGGPSSVTVTDTSGTLTPDAAAILGQVYQDARIVESGPLWAGCTAIGGLLGQPPSFLRPATHVLIDRAAKGLESPTTATAAARAYHTATDARFTAGGKFSKVIVPRTAKALHPVLATGGKLVSGVGWGLLAYDAYEAARKCN